VNTLFACWRTICSGRQKTDLSWWPKHSAWKKCGGQNVGCWLQECKDWFQSNSIIFEKTRLFLDYIWEQLIIYWLFIWKIDVLCGESTTYWLCIQNINYILIICQLYLGKIDYLSINMCETLIIFADHEVDIDHVCIT
jgi:hypothetical protein